VPSRHPHHYDQLQPLLQASLQRFHADGRPVRDYIAYARRRFGPPIRPYLLQLFIDLSSDAKGNEQAPIPAPVSPERRQAMIEKTAYLLSEKAGFQGDSQEFWRRAITEVDERLGLTGKPAAESDA
jgi:hypothetical protein